MRRLIHGLAASLAAVPLTVYAILMAAPAASAARPPAPRQPPRRRPAW